MESRLAVPAQTCADWLPSARMGSRSSLAVGWGGVICGPNNPLQIALQPDDLTGAYVFLPHPKRMPLASLGLITTVDAGSTLRMPSSHPTNRQGASYYCLPWSGRAVLGYPIDFSAEGARGNGEGGAPWQWTSKQVVNIEQGLIGRQIFIDPEIYAQELEQIFARCWLFLCHESQIPTPAIISSAPIWVKTRCWWCGINGGQVHAFLNICRHRGNRLCRADARQC